ncbi:MAG: branched-chain amino acid ABC transporter permease, partial [Rhodospirillaceae bacterium]
AAQGWNLLAGFAGLFSLGHALFIGLAAYLTAALALHGAAGAWAGALLALPAAALAGAAVGALGCRAGLSGPHFTLATLILAEAARLGALRLEGLGGGAGLTLPALPSGKPLLFYYAILILAGLSLAAVRLLLRSRLGYRWLALREDPQAAAAIGIEPCRARVTAVAISAALAAPAGVFLALYARHVDPEHTLSLAASLAPVLAATLGGIGTLVGPVLGTFLVVPVDLGLSWLIAHSPRDLTLLKPLAAGLALMLAAAAFPDGLWPGLARLLRLLKPSPADDGGGR